MKKKYFCSVGRNFDCPKFPENAQNFDSSRYSNSNIPLDRGSICSLNVPIENFTSLKADWFQDETISGALTLISDCLNHVPKCAFITSLSLYRNFFFPVFTGLIPPIEISIKNRVFLRKYSFEKNFYLRSAASFFDKLEIPNDANNTSLSHISSSNFSPKAGVISSLKVSIGSPTFLQENSFQKK